MHFTSPVFRCLNHYLLSHPTVRSFPRAHGLSAGQEIVCLPWNMKVHYSPLNTACSQLNPVNTLFFFLVGWDRVGLSPLGIEDTVWPIVQASDGQMMTMEQLVE